MAIDQQISKEAGQAVNPPATCGEGIAQRAAFPARLGELTAAIAESLERHLGTLDDADPNAAKERDAYHTLVKDFRGLTGQLESVSARMSGYRDLPMARHDARALGAPEVREAHVRLIEHEQAVVELLSTWIEQDRAMLGAT
jgi:hypothetical protein